jgi:hypothetical protein
VSINYTVNSLKSALGLEVEGGERKWGGEGEANKNNINLSDVTVVNGGGGGR